MASNSKIEWTTHTFNPWRGCTKVSAGCANCYAETMSKRNPKVLGIWGDNGTRVVASESMWRWPVKWNQAAEKAGERHRVFCASLADVAEDRSDVELARWRLKKIICETPHLDWLLLSKRPENYLRLFWGPEGWPSNVWVGTSVEDQQTADERIPHLLRVPAAVRFLSCEPLLGAINLTPHLEEITHSDETSIETMTLVDWVIVGGESGPGARPCDIAWIRSIIGQCKAAGVPCFVKQLGSYARLRAHHMGSGPESDVLFRFETKHPKGGDCDEWPEDLRVRQFPTPQPAAKGM